MALHTEILSAETSTLLKLIKTDSSQKNEAEEELVKRYSPLVKSCARPFYLWGWETEDFIQEGMMALIKAIRYYDESKSPYFGVFAELTIRRHLAETLGMNTRKKDIPSGGVIPLEDGEHGDELLSVSGIEETVIYKDEIDRKITLIKQKLSKFEKKVLNCYLSGMSFTQMAQKLCLSKRSVNNAMYRIRAKSESI